MGGLVRFYLVDDVAFVFSHFSAVITSSHVLSNLSLLGGIAGGAGACVILVVLGMIVYYWKSEKTKYSAPWDSTYVTRTSGECLFVCTRVCVCVCVCTCVCVHV